MSPIYALALIGTSLGLSLLYIVVASLLAKLKQVNIHLGVAHLIILFIGIFLTVWGIDMLTHLDQL